MTEDICIHFSLMPLHLISQSDILTKYLITWYATMVDSVWLSIWTNHFPFKYWQISNTKKAIPKIVNFHRLSVSEFHMKMNHSLSSIFKILKCYEKITFKKNLFAIWGHSNIALSTINTTNLPLISKVLFY